VVGATLAPLNDGSCTAVHINVLKLVTVTGIEVQ